MQKSGVLVAELLNDELEVSGTETSIELNLTRNPASARMAELFLPLRDAGSLGMFLYCRAVESPRLGASATADEALSAPA